MDAKSKVLDLIAREEKVLGSLLSKKRTHALRACSFRNAVLAIRGDESQQAKKAQKDFGDRIASEEALEKQIELKIADAKTSIAALREAVGMIRDPVRAVVPHVLPAPTVDAAQNSAKTFRDLRPTSELYLVREILRKVGKPMLLDEIIAELGHPGDKQKRSSLRGTLMGYAKQGNVFTLESKTPKIFGLVEFKGAKVSGDTWAQL